MEKENIFSHKEIDAFKELGNVGAGHAAIALSKFFSKEVDMSIPFIRVGDEETILLGIKLNEEHIVGFTVTEVIDPLRYKLSVIFKESVILSLLKLLSATSRVKIKSEDDLSDMQKSLIQEIGSTIILRYVAALNKMLKVDSLPHSAPEFKLLDPLTAVKESGYNDTSNLFFIQLDLFTDEQTFECHLLIQPHHESLEGYRKAFFL